MSLVSSRNFRIRSYQIIDGAENGGDSRIELTNPIFCTGVLTNSTELRGLRERTYYCIINGGRVILLVYVREFKGFENELG